MLKTSVRGVQTADEIQTKNKKYDNQRKRLFLPQWKQNGRGWSTMTRKKA